MVSILGYIPISNFALQADAEFKEILTDAGVTFQVEGEAAELADIVAWINNSKIHEEKVRTKISTIDIREIIDGIALKISKRKR